MNASDLRWWAVVPAVVYTAAVGLAARPSLDGVSIAVAAALALPLAGLVTPRLGAWWFAPAIAVVLAGLGLAAVNPNTATAPLAPVLLGALLGGPALALAVFGAARRSSAAGPVGSLGTLAVAAVELAVVRGLPPTVPSSAHAWAMSLSAVLSSQGTALHALATGAEVPAAPLSYTGDVAFDALAVVALIGLLISWLDPLARTGLARTPPPTPERGDGGSTGGPTPGLGRTGARSLVVAVFAVLLFEVAGAVSPVDALLGLAVAAPLAVGVVLVLTRMHGSRAAIVR